jgi:hypothetical protein
MKPNKNIVLVRSQRTVSETKARMARELISSTEYATYLIARGFIKGWKARDKKQKKTKKRR